MKSLLNGIAMRLLPKSTIMFIQKPLRDKLKILNHSYSQNGEDILVKRVFNLGFKGFFVDVGAHHPIRFSNTYFLYQKGWRGLNIDAMPGSMKVFQEYRPGDQNVEIGISDTHGVLKYFLFNESALNTFNEDEALRKAQKGEFYIVNTIDVEVAPLSNVLDRYVPANTNIDYLNIDVEGLDMQVLKSNNWQKYRPSLIAVESHYSEGPIQNSEIYRFLTDLDYRLISVLFNTLFFAKNDSSVHSELRL